RRAGPSRSISSKSSSQLICPLSKVTSWRRKSERDMPAWAACSLSRRCTSSGTWRIWIIRVLMRNSIGACVAHAPDRFGALSTAPDPPCSGLGEADPEALEGEFEDDLAGGHQVGDAVGGE